ncbi:MAG: HPr family phosphocarrier protein [Desulfamplus sp.]|nr:HPr family phosphocarrier protein [Desulfamplus sp.]
MIRKVFVKNSLGLHARPAAMITRMAGKAEKTIWIVDGEKRADASSVIDILTLNAGKGTSLSIETESENDIDVLNDLAKFFESGFGEDGDG